MIEYKTRLGEKILNFVMWIIILIVILLFVLLVFGSSPTVDQVAVGVLVGFLLQLYRKVEKLDKARILHYAEHKTFEEKLQKIIDKLKIK